jgi:hypothetical protein
VEDAVWFFILLLFPIGIGVAIRFIGRRGEEERPQGQDMEIREPFTWGGG